MNTTTSPRSLQSKCDPERSCQNPYKHSSMECYPSYVEMTYPESEPMSFDEWRRV